MSAISQIQRLPIADLQAHPNNTRIHSKRQIEQIAQSIEKFGFVAPVLVDDSNVLIAGHGRLAAAKANGLTEVPAIVVSGLTRAQKRALALADNKIAQNAGWDRQKLAFELESLTPLLEDEGLDISLTGFEVIEIDSLLEDLVDAEADPLDEAPPPPCTATTRPGDLWLLGQHKLLCADARLRDSYAMLMRHRRASMVFADPPYNLATSRIQGRGGIKHGNFAAAAGEMSGGEFTRFLQDAFTQAAHFSTPGSVHFICMDWRHLDEISMAGKFAYTELLNLIVWAKTNAGQGSFYRSQHELIFAFKNGDGRHTNNFELGQHGRHRSNVWTYAGANSFRAGRLDDLALHPTVKPVALVADAIRDCSRRGEIVLDPFMGSGTTILAAERVGRWAYGLEIDPAYADVAVRRWQNFTKADAVLAGTDATFEDITRSRPSNARRR